MTNRRRVAVWAAVLSGAVLIGAPGADATCATALCTSPPSQGIDRIGGIGSDGDGTICTYIKWSGSRPEGVDTTGGAPYIWQETRAWGNTHAGQYDEQICYPLCTVHLGSSVTCRVSPSAELTLPGNGH